MAHGRHSFSSLPRVLARKLPPDSTMLANPRQVSEGLAMGPGGRSPGTMPPMPMSMADGKTQREELKKHSQRAVGFLPGFVAKRP
eukprot:1408580-Rhodomonas_salina.2